MPVQSKMKGLFAGLDNLGSTTGNIDGCFVINCHKKDKIQYIQAASIDIGKLTVAFEKNGSNVQTLEANNARDITETLKTKDFSSNSGLCLVVLSHGAVGDIITFRNSGIALKENFLGIILQ
jgi:hypothetical protein